MSSTVRVKMNTGNINLLNKRAVQGLFKMAYDIASQARINAPVVTGALRATIRVRETNSQEELEVVAGGQFGSRIVDYAAIREKGPNRNHSTEHYMENAARSVMTGNYIKKYFGEIA